MKKLLRLFKTEGYELIKENEQTQTYRFHDVFSKVYIGKDSKKRYQRELEFYTNYSSRHVPVFVETKFIRAFPIIITKLLPEHGLGFISDDEVKLLQALDFEHIYNAIREIQSQVNDSILVHSDLAPHNIYVNGVQVIISDWDQYQIETDMRHQMFDFATLWYRLYVDENRLAVLFEQHIKNFLKYEGMFENFMYCYKEITASAKIVRAHHLKRGKHLREVILNST